MASDPIAADPVAYAFGTEKHGAPFLLRVLWFLLVGWWLGAIFIGLGYVFTGLLITLPLGFWFLNRIGRAMTLMPMTTEVIVASSASGSDVLVQRRAQVFWPLRIVYMLLAGLWLGGIWLTVAYALCISIVFMPVGLWMINRAPLLITLERR